jgi:aminoglycoside phosphotransferase (APT) family kinase protein
VTTMHAVPRMHADEVETDVALVRHLLADQFPRWAALSIDAVPSWGTDNALYRLGDEMVVRLPRLERSVLALRKERTWLPKLAPRLPLRVPVPLAVGVPADGYPFEWSVYSWLDGVDATTGTLVDDAHVAEALERFLVALQRIDATDGPAPGEHNVHRGEPLRRRDRRTRQSIDALRGSMDADAVTAAWEAALTAPDWSGRPLWIHGDLDARNLLVENGRLSGVIDWGCLGVGDPACDVTVAWKVLSPEARAAFRDALSVDDATWARARGWVLSQAVNALSYYTIETNPALVVEARRWLREVLVSD